VHESALVDPIERWRHKTIIASRLLAVLLIVAIAPLFLACGGIPDRWTAVAFGWLILPLGSVALLSRTGRVVAAQAIAATSVLGFALTLGAGAGPLWGAAFAWLILAPLEGVIAQNLFLVCSAGFAALVAALGLAAEVRFGTSALGSFVSWRVGLLSAPVLVYATWVASWSVHLQQLRGRVARVGAARLDSLSDALGDLVLRHDRSGAVLFASGDCETLFGVSPRELMGRGFFERVHVADRPTFLTVIADAADLARTVTATLRLRVSMVGSSEDGFEEPVFAWVELRARQLADVATDLEAASVVAVVRDVTAHKRREEEVEDSRIEAERAAVWKDRFLANVSHELRTPLNAIIGFSEMLASEELAPRDPEKRREYAEIVHSSGQHLLAVVNSILDMSKIEAGRFDILHEAFDVAQLVGSCYDMVSLKAQQGSVQIVRSCPAGLPELVADKRACKQILLNLLSNAVKFTPAGGRVTIAARAEGNSLLISVSDTGIGVSPRDLPHLGDAFFQARSSYDRPYEGTGLGLSVVRGLVGLHGGVIAIESAQGEGTCVTVRLPVDGRLARASTCPAKIEVLARVAKHNFDPSPVPVPMVKKIA
jgi:cell cycle sensor histidine kinase DivJ